MSAGRRPVDETSRWRPAGFFDTAALVVFVLFALICTTPAAADEPPNEASETTSPSSGETEPREPTSCDWYFVDQQLQEKSREVLRSWSCYTFRWVDGWFGDEHEFDADAVNGWMTIGGEYRKYDGFDGRLRLKVRAPLPNMSSRWNLWLGRLDEDSYLTDTMGQGGNYLTPGITGLSDPMEDDSWLLGLGHRRPRRNSGWDWSVGVRLNWPPEPYAKLWYYHFSKPSENTNLRLRQTLFWRNDDHQFGTTSRGDLTWRMDDVNAIFWEGSATWSDDTEGARWFAGQTWYHLFPGGTAMSFLAFVKGETERDVPLRDYGFNLIWRRPFTRDYLYISFGPSLTWPRKKEEDVREMNIGFGVWLEMEFGDWRY
jgi:hypothetical protein